MREGQTLPTLTRPFWGPVRAKSIRVENGNAYLLTAGAAGQRLLLRALGGDGEDAEHIDGRAVDANGDWDEVDGLLDELVAAGRLLVVGALVLGSLARSGALLHVVCWEGSGREGEGEGGDDAGELHFGWRLKIEDWSGKLVG